MRRPEPPCSSAERRASRWARNGALEVSGRLQSGRLIGIHTLETAGIPSSIQGDAVKMIEVGPGSNKQLSIEGLMWAPYATMDFRNVSNDAVAAINGGAVLSEVFLQAPASANNFLVTNGSGVGNRRMEFIATATSPGGGKTQARRSSSTAMPTTPSNPGACCASRRMTRPRPADASR